VPVFERDARQHAGGAVSGMKNWRRIALIVAPFLAVAAGVIVGRLMH